MKKHTYNKPTAEVVVINHQSVICQSGGTQNFDNGSTDNWYN